MFPPLTRKPIDVPVVHRRDSRRRRFGRTDRRRRGCVQLPFGHTRYSGQEVLTIPRKW